jgi:recombination protein RecA
VFGVDLDDVLLYEPASIEDVLSGMRDGLMKIPDGLGPNLMAWDSFAMSTLQGVVDKGIESKNIGKKAALMAEQWPAITRLAKEARTAVMLINQSRTKIGLVFGNPTTTPGGETHKFTASARLQLWAGSKVQEDGEPVGMDTTISAVKNKLAIPGKKAKLRLRFDTGWDDAWTTINHAKDRGVIEARARVTEETHQAARRALGWAE